MALGEPGTFHLTRYNVPGNPLWHERLALGSGAAGVSTYVLTPDDDRYLEEIGAGPDIIEVRPLIGHMNIDRDQSRATSIDFDQWWA